ncbi:hypothetical protein OC834_000257 [Tilletia horrida]|nr:hypothetical protein OC835_007236 [Tilletia horrida]KAK0538932.1 hypothetical protein OC834_000257 [Tilletia horrida]
MSGLNDNDFPTAPRYDESTVSTAAGPAVAAASSGKGLHGPVTPVGAEGSHGVNRSGVITVAPMRKAEMQTSYAQNLGLDDQEQNFYGSMLNCFGDVAGCLGQVPFCFCCPNPYHSVEQGSVGLITRFGRLYKSVDPGLVKVNPFSEQLRRVDVKITLISIPRQVVLTSDNLTIEVDSSLCYHISNPLRAAFSVSNVTQALSERAQTTLRDVIGSRSLQSILTDREAVAQQIAQLVENVSESWGVTVESLLLKDISLSPELQESLAFAATQRRQAEGKLIAAQAEVQAAKLMREAADQLSTEAAIQIRQLEALQAMAKSSHAKTIFVPMSLAHQYPSSSASASNSKGKAPESAGGQTMLSLNEVTSLGQLASS